MKLKKDIIIAIDGPSSSGKSSLARHLAEELNYIYIDTGAMYRAVTLWAIENKLFENNQINKKKLIDNLKNLQINFSYDRIQKKSRIFLNGEDVESKIRQPFVSEKVSYIAEIPEVREHLVCLQQKIGANKKVVMDGRDIGTKVFPDAEIKFFITASPKVRALRRFNELTVKGINVSYEQIYQNILERDYIDSHRTVDPLKPADDAIFIDNTNINEYETFIVTAAIIATRFGDGVHF